ncbi:MAG: M3 family oligoendopeptidase [Hydrogenibacillus sp.]|nr:M3 family oligoendopeptidase [Hydrogenibacillus sp.]
MALSLTWDLESIFVGGPTGEPFQRFVADLVRDIEALKSVLNEEPVPRDDAGAERLYGHLNALQALGTRLREAGAYLSCLTAQNVDDETAKRESTRLSSVSAAYAKALIRFDALLLGLSDDVFQSLKARAQADGLDFLLEERRLMARERMAPELEALEADLAVDGYHAWGELYNTIVGRLNVEVTIGGQTKRLSVGQAFNLLSHPDRAVRKQVFERYDAAWESVADLNAEVLNHLSGYRLAVYRHRGWDDVLHEPLRNNRMRRETLEAMWAAVEKGKPALVRYLQQKARLLGLDALAFYDVDAPVGEAGAHIPYEDGAALIIEQFATFSADLADLAERAFRERWIEAEDRPGKRPGGFCTSFPLKQQSRIFMTYSGTPDNVSTLAHELGHAYHQHVMNDLPAMAQRYAMNVAETASTFAEQIVSEALIAKADEGARLRLLDEKLSRAVAFFMNIHARFLFETRFYEARKSTPVPRETLGALMLEAQREAYHGALGEWHANFWQSKLHFYLTRTPFYNFPYTFGYLFSTGLYAMAKAEGPSFADRYVALLRDTGRMTVEALAEKHLGVDLTRADFWEQAVDEATRDVETFIRLAERQNG